MGLFRRAPTRQRPSQRERVTLIDVPRSSADPRRQLLAVTAEALILQDEAEAVLVGVRARQHMGLLAPRGGPLVHRFFCLRDRLPSRFEDPNAERLRASLDSILHHHAMLVSTALDLLACEWRSERIANQIDALDGLGEPGRLLEGVYAELMTHPVS